MHRKAKVDQLNLVFVILKLGLIAGKLCVHVTMCLLTQCLLIASAFTVTSRCRKHVWVCFFVCGV